MFKLKIVLIFSVLLLSFIGCSRAEYAVGDAGPAGGIVFHVNDSESGEWQYLEAWIKDEEDAYQWLKIEQTSDVDAVGTMTTVGQGYINTYEVMLGPDHQAAEVARSASHGGYDDWFLPSKFELYEMYLQKEIIGGFENKRYWSSSEDSSHSAWFVHFQGGGLSTGWKYYRWRVRLARSF